MYCALRSPCSNFTFAVCVSRCRFICICWCALQCGWLIRRRPNATFHKTRFKPVYFVLTADSLQYWTEPPPRKPIHPFVFSLACFFFLFLHCSVSVISFFLWSGLLTHTLYMHFLCIFRG